MTTDRDHRIELNILKSMLEWSVTIPRNVWTVEGFEIYRIGGRYNLRYEINHIGKDETLASPPTLVEAFRWVAKYTWRGEAMAETMIVDVSTWTRLAEVDEYAESRGIDRAQAILEFVNSGLNNSKRKAP